MIYFFLFSLMMMASIFILKIHSKRSKVRKRLVELSCGQKTRTAEASIKKIIPFQGNRKYALLIRIDGLLTSSDRVFIALLAIALPVVGYFSFADIAVEFQFAGSVSLWLLSVFALATYRRRLQIEEFETGIVHVLGLVSRAVSAGLSIPQAIDQVAQTQPGVLGREFSRIRDNLALGLSLRVALDDACIRLPYSSFRYFSVALILNQANGGQLREILHSLSRTMHDNRAMRKKVKSLTSEPRMTAMFLSILPIALLSIMVWWEPTMVSPLFDSDSGQGVMTYVGSSIVLGILSLNAMTRNKRFKL